MLYLILVSIMVFISAVLSGFFAPAFPQKDATAKDIPSWYRCCDSGDGEACKPRADQTFKYDGKPYALLKSDTYPVVGDEQYDHFTRDGNVKGVGGIYINTANDHDNRDRSDQCKVNNRNSTDWIRGGPDDKEEGGCTTIPKKTLVYLCRYDKNPGDLCNKTEIKKPSATLDVYIRLSDANNIPNAIKNCNKPKMPESSEKKIVFRPSPDGQSNLQLRTFKFVEDTPRIRWLAPFCKPAIYLYPEKKTEINVSVYPQGKMLLTIPEYPKNGWDVVATSDGSVFYQDKRFDYLYYEASLPDQLIHKPKEGFVIAYNERQVFLTDLVQKLGLNEKETEQFIEYWVPILPKAPYYFVGVMPESELHELSPVFITPKPTTFIRVSLYFQALEKKIPVAEPTLPVRQREGFTAVEWGGIFKQDSNHPFSCFM